MALIETSRRRCGYAPADRYQPPPPPPPPPPPEDPPPPEPLLEPGAVDADATVLASEAPPVPAKRPGPAHTWPEPEYQPNVLPWRVGAASAAASTEANLSAQWFST